MHQSPSSATTGRTVSSGNSRGMELGGRPDEAGDRKLASGKQDDRSKGGAQ